MAKKKTPNRKSRKANVKTKKKGMGWQGRVFAIGMLFGSLVVMPTTIVFVIGMIPSLVSIYVDKDPKKRSVYAIGSLNLAPVIGYIIILWSEGHMMSNAMMMLTNPTTLMIIYFSAWIGWVIHYMVPPIVAEFVKKSAMKRLKAIKVDQAKLIKDWGDGVRGDYAAPSKAISTGVK